MDTLTVDFETFYDDEVSLRKMTTIEYIMHPQFQPILMSYALNDAPVQCAVGYREIKDVLDSYDWDNIILNAQNTQFDGRIITERFGKYPKFYTDTMAMARASGAHIFKGASLASIADLLRELGLPIPPKGTTVANAKGMRLYDMYTSAPYLAKTALHTEAEKNVGRELLSQYIEYCNHDVIIAREAFKYFAGILPPDEIRYGDMILKCYLQPRTFLSLPVIEDEIVRIEKRDHDRAINVANKYFGGDIRELRGVCRSAPKFTAFLKALGGILKSEHPYLRTDEDVAEAGYRFVIPERYSNAKEIVEPCYSRSYSGMMDMLEHPDDDIAELFQCKLDLTSSIELSRAKRFESIAKLNRGFGFPYTVSGAHTHRLGGAGGLNLQNLSSGRKKGQSKALKQSIVAPEGHKIVVFDSSQIELRTGSYLANDHATLQMFIEGKDPYSEQASLIYGGDPAEIKKLAKQDVEPYSNIQRPVGKSSLLSCIYGTGAGGFQNYLKVNGITMALAECKNIVDIYRNSHPTIVNLWNEIDRALIGMANGQEGYFGGRDGKSFFYSGKRRVHGRVVAGIRLPDGNWLNYYNIRKEMRKMPDGSTKMNWVYEGVKGSKMMSIYTYSAKVFENCIAEGTEVLTDSGWKFIEDIQDTDLVFDGIDFVNHKGLICKSKQACVSIDGVYMTHDHKVLTTDGWRTANECLQNDVRTSQLCRFNEPTIRNVSGNKGSTSARYKAPKVVLQMRLWWRDIKDWYGNEKRLAGWKNTKLRLYKSKADFREEPKARYVPSPAVCGVAFYEVPMYQADTQSVEELRSSWHNSLRQVVSGLSEFCGGYVSNIRKWAGFRPHRQRQGLLQRELSVGITRNKLQQQAFVGSYIGGRGRDDNQGVWQKIWAGAIDHLVQARPRSNNARTSGTTEFCKTVYDIKECGKRHRFVVRGRNGLFAVHNCNQAYAFAIMKYQAMLVNKRYQIILNTHDEWGICVPDDEVEEATAYMQWCMRQVPEWATGLPVDCEGSMAQNYGDCK